jgi:hypothetical protein
MQPFSQDKARRSHGDRMIRNWIIFATLLAAASPAASLAKAQEPVLAQGRPETQQCLLTRSIQQTVIGPDRKYYVRMRGGGWWRNTMECAMLVRPRVLVHSSPIGSQCKGDIVQVVDFMMGGVNFGGCGFGDWEKVDGPPDPKAKPRR